MLCPQCCKPQPEINRHCITFAINSDSAARLSLIGLLRRQSFRPLRHRLVARTGAPPAGLPDRPFSNGRPGPRAGCFCRKSAAMLISFAARRPLSGTRATDALYRENMAILALRLDLAAAVPA